MEIRSKTSICVALGLSLLLCANQLLASHRPQHPMRLEISYPPDGTVVRPGNTVHVNLKPINDFVPAHFILRSSLGDETAVEIQEYPRHGRPYIGTYRIPDTAKGTIEIVAIGLDDLGTRVVSDPLALWVETEDPLVRIVIRNDSQGRQIDLYGPYARERLDVWGSFVDGSERNLSGSAAGTTYQSTDPVFATVDAEGVVRPGKRDGRTTIVATNGARSTFVNVIVTGVNGRPRFVRTYNQQVVAEQHLEFTITTEDPEGTVSSLRAEILPNGAEFFDNGDGTGVFRWTPTRNDIGFHDVKIRATDGLDPGLLGGAWIMVEVIP